MNSNRDFAHLLIDLGGIWAASQIRRLQPRDHVVGGIATAWIGYVLADRLLHRGAGEEFLISMIDSIRL